MHIKRIDSIHRQNPSNNSTMSLHDEQISSSPPTNPFSSMDKSDSQMSLGTSPSARSSLSNIFKVNRQQNDSLMNNALSSPWIFLRNIELNDRILEV